MLNFVQYGACLHSSVSDVWGLAFFWTHCITTAGAVGSTDYCTCVGNDCSAAGITDRKSTSASMWSSITAARTTRCLCSVNRCTWGNVITLLQLPLLVCTVFNQ